MWGRPGAPVGRRPGDDRAARGHAKVGWLRPAGPRIHPTLGEHRRRARLLWDCAGIPGPRLERVATSPGSTQNAVALADPRRAQRGPAGSRSQWRRANWVDGESHRSGWRPQACGEPGCCRCPRPGEGRPRHREPASWRGPSREQRPGTGAWLGRPRRPCCGTCSWPGCRYGPYPGSAAPSSRCVGHCRGTGTWPEHRRSAPRLCA